MLKKILPIVLVFMLSVLLLPVYGCKTTETADVTTAQETAVQETAAEEAETTAAEATTTGEKIQLNFMNSYSYPGWIEPMEEIISIYMEQNPNIEIINDPQDPMQMPVLLQTAAAAGDGPDVITGMEGAAMLYLADILVDLKQYFTPEELAIYNPDVLFTGYYAYDTSAKLMGVPTQGLGFFHLIYNKAIFAESGIDWEPTAENDYRMTWDEFISACQTLKAAGHTPIGWGNEGGYMWAWWWVPLMVQNLEEGDAYKLFRGELRWNDPKVVTGFEKANELYQMGFFNEGGLTLPAGEGTATLMLSGQAAMGASFWGLGTNVYVEAMGENFGMMKCPIYNPEGSLANALDGGSPQKFLITTWCEHPEEAAAFIKFLTSTENAAFWYEKCGHLPVNVDFDSSMITGEYDKLAWEWISAEENLQPDFTAIAMPNEVFAESAGLSIELLNGNITAQQYCDSLNSRFESLEYPWIVK